MAVRAVGGDEWVLWRGLRLEALLADPEAFASTHEREAVFDEATWRERMTSFEDRPIGTFVDEVDGQAVAMAAIGFFDSDTVPMVVSMWVRQTARGLGCGRRLLDATVDWTRGQSASEVKLWVKRDNEAATAMYERYGFVASGTVNAPASDPCAGELEMRLAVPH